jgi:RNA polymerase sigma factor (sigma-70 family)
VSASVRSMLCAMLAKVVLLNNCIGKFYLSSIPPRIELHELRILITKVASGDAEALRTLYIGTSSKLYRDAFRILKKHELAEDVLQETFIAIWRNAISYRSNLSAPTTWMAAILRNKAFDLLRTVTYTIEIDAENFDENILSSFIEQSTTPLEYLELSRRVSVLATCMKQLDTAHRQVVYMAFYDEMSHSEIAIHLDIPIGTVKTWIRRSLGRLGASLNKLEAQDRVL